MRAAQAEKVFYRALSRGATRDDAAIEAGIPIHLLDVWFARAEEGLEPYVAFFRNIQKVETSYKNRMIAQVVGAGKGDPRSGLKPNWNASAWMLERRWGPEFARLDEEKVATMMASKFATIRDGVVRTVLKFVPDEQQEAAAEALQIIFLEE